MAGIVQKKKTIEYLLKNIIWTENKRNRVKKLEEMDNWCKKMKIEATPTFFVNAYQLPGVYKIEDVKSWQITIKSFSFATI